MAARMGRSLVPLLSSARAVFTHAGYIDPHHLPTHTTSLPLSVKIKTNKPDKTKQKDQNETKNVLKTWTIVCVGELLLGMGSAPERDRYTQ